jgi:hypothetical protein
VRGWAADARRVMVNTVENNLSSDWFAVLCARDIFAMLRIENNVWELSSSLHETVRGEPLGSPMETVRLAYREAVARGDTETLV